MSRSHNADNGAQMVSQQCSVEQFRYTKINIILTNKIIKIKKYRQNISCIKQTFSLIPLQKKKVTSIKVSAYSFKNVTYKVKNCTFLSVHTLIAYCIALCIFMNWHLLKNNIMYLYSKIHLRIFHNI